MDIDRNIILNRFKKMDDLVKILEDLKKKPKDEFLSNYLLYLSAQRTCKYIY